MADAYTRCSCGTTITPWTPGAAIVCKHLAGTDVEDEQLACVHMSDVEPAGRRIKARVVEPITRAWQPHARGLLQRQRRLRRERAGRHHRGGCRHDRCDKNKSNTCAPHKSPFLDERVPRPYGIHATRLTHWLWLIVIYLLVVLLIFALSHYFGTTVPVRAGSWDSQLEHFRRLTHHAVPGLVKTPPDQVQIWEKDHGGPESSGGAPTLGERCCFCPLPG